MRFCFDDTVLIKYTAIQQIKKFLGDIYFPIQSLIPYPSREHHVSLLYSYYGTSNPLMTAGAKDEEENGRLVWAAHLICNCNLMACLVYKCVSVAAYIKQTLTHIL